MTARREHYLLTRVAIWWHALRNADHGMHVNRAISTPGRDISARGVLTVCACGRTWAS